MYFTVARAPRGISAGLTESRSILTMVPSSNFSSTSSSLNLTVIVFVFELTARTSPDKVLDPYRLLLLDGSLLGCGCLPSLAPFRATARRPHTASRSRSGRTGKGIGSSPALLCSKGRGCNPARGVSPFRFSRIVSCFGRTVKLPEGHRRFDAPPVSLSWCVIAGSLLLLGGLLLFDLLGLLPSCASASSRPSSCQPSSCRPSWRPSWARPSWPCRQPSTSRSLIRRRPFCSAFGCRSGLGEAQTRRRHHEHHGKQDCENLLHLLSPPFH